MTIPPQETAPNNLYLSENERLWGLANAFQISFRAGDLQAAWQFGSQLLGLDDLEPTYGQVQDADFSIQELDGRQAIYGSSNEEPVNAWMSMNEASNLADRIRVMQVALWQGLGAYRWHYGTDSKHRVDVDGAVAISSNFEPRFVQYTGTDQMSVGAIVHNFMKGRNYMHGDNSYPPVYVWCRSYRYVGGAEIAYLLTEDPRKLVAEWESEAPVRVDHILAPWHVPPSTEIPEINRFADTMPQDNGAAMLEDTGELHPADLT